MLEIIVQRERSSSIRDNTNSQEEYSAGGGEAEV
jgi:hypothetical protein